MIGVFGFVGSNFYWLFKDLLPIDQKFPEPVAIKLRRALWYTDKSPDVKQALENYYDAIRLAHEHGMSSFDREVLGIKIKIAETLEKFRDAENAIIILDRLRQECREFLDSNPADLPPSERSNILAVTVKTSIKIAELYGSDAIQDSAAAERNLTEGVEVILKEQRRRQEEGVLPEEEGENEWFGGEEAGATFERLANHYEAASKHYLAAPLYLRALMLSPRTCHAALLMNNLGQSLAQTLPDSGANMAATRETFIENATLWAEKSLATAAEIRPPLRNEECDLTCVVATHNLGEFAEMQHRYDEARTRYVEAMSLAKALNFEDGVRNAQEALRRIDKLRAG